MATIKLLLRKNKQKANGEIPLYLRITENRKSRFLSTGISIKPSHWNERIQRVKKSHPLYAVFNDRLERLLNEAQTKAIELKDNKRVTISAEAVKSELTGRSVGDFFSFADTYINNLDQERKFWEWKKARVLLGKLKQFEGSQELSFEKLDYDYLIRFEKYMREELGNATNTIWKNMQIFHRILKRAIRKELITPGDNPFLHYTSKTAKTAKEKLSIKEIDALKGLDLKPNSALWHTRNYFLFSFYCAGIRFGDLCRLTWENVLDGHLYYRMAKTETPKSLKLLPPAQAILEPYRKKAGTSTHFIFPILNNNKDYSDPRFIRQQISSKNAIVNKNLKQLAQLAGIQKNVSFHVSRHSFADFARTQGMDLYSISKALGHANLNITETYLKSFDQNMVNDAMAEVFKDHS